MSGAFPLLLPPPPLPLLLLLQSVMRRAGPHARLRPVRAVLAAASPCRSAEPQLLPLRALLSRLCPRRAAVAAQWFMGDAAKKELAGATRAKGSADK